MFKKITAILLALVTASSLTACGNNSTETSSQNSESTNSQTSSDSSSSTSSDNSSDSAPSESNESSESSTSVVAEDNTPAAVTVSNSLALDKETLISTYPDKFKQITYTDTDTGLSITYNLYLPENYDKSASYPMVVFIGDSSCAGSNATISLTQGRGGLVWATEEWQSAYPTIVAVPTYPVTILDDHGSYTTTEYVELTKRYIDYMCEEYAVDRNRIYGTGQSMGCMTTLILASKYPDLYAACMFVDGQWDIDELKGLEEQTFVYFAAEDDTNAWNGAQEVISMFDDDAVAYTYAQWDGNWTPDELSEAAKELFASGTSQNFISWKTGTIEPKSGMGGGSGGFGGPGGNGDFGGPGGHGGRVSLSMSAGANSSSYHMASFDYAYNCVAVMEWLFQQVK